MSQRRIKSESIENLKRVVDNKTSDVEIVGGMNIVMADAYEDSIKNDANKETVMTELEKIAKEADIVNESVEQLDESGLRDFEWNDPLWAVVKEDGTYAGVPCRSYDEARQLSYHPGSHIFKLELDEPVENEKLTFDEAVEEFTMEAPVKDGRSNKVYEDDGEDDYLDYDMFDFIYGLVTDCWPKPLNPLGGRLRKFLYIGSDKYTENPNSVENKDGHSQVASTGDAIEVYSNDESAFNDIREICKLYKFEYEGPTERRSLARHWKYSFTIKIPSHSSGYPMMVEDYFEDLGMTMEDVMPQDFCAQYRKRQAKLNQEVDERIEEKEVEKKVNAAILAAARDNTEPLSVHLKRLYKELDDANLTYKKNQVKKAFMDAFDDGDE